MDAFEKPGFDEALRVASVTPAIALISGAVRAVRSASCIFMRTRAWAGFRRPSFLRKASTFAGVGGEVEQVGALRRSAASCHAGGSDARGPACAGS